MNKTEVKDFFNNLASTWDEHMIIDDETTNFIFDKALIKQGDSVLDVATGTGVLIPYYLVRTNNITGIDISEEMIQIAKSKYPNVNLLCLDVDEYHPTNKFDHIMIYNAFPHFVDPDLTITRLQTLLKTGGTLTIAHNMSYEKLKKHHDNGACHVTNHIFNQEEMNALIRNHNLEIITSIYDDNKMIVVGKQK